jgi:phosphate transport system permease protein
VTAGIVDRGGPDGRAASAVGAPSAPSGGRRAFGISIQGQVVGDRIYTAVVTLFALCVPTLLILIAVEIARAAWPAFHTFGLSFLTTSAWDPVKGVFGAAPAIYGTLVSSLIALLIATPLALGVAVFLSEFSPPAIRQPIAFLVDLLAAIPSVV